MGSKLLAPDMTTEAEWRAEGERRFGPDMLDWAFVCPICDRVTTIREYLEAGVDERAVAFSCIGRWIGGRSAFDADAEDERDNSRGCDYAGGGSFRINPVALIRENGVIQQIFAFAPPVDSATPRGED